MMKETLGLPLGLRVALWRLKRRSCLYTRQGIQQYRRRRDKLIRQYSGRHGDAGQFYL